MTFLVFEQFADGDQQALRPTGQEFKLAGRNLIYQAWLKRGQPVNEGWHITRDELLDLHFGDGTRPPDPRLVIDFHPGATGRIGLIEPLDIYAYTYGAENTVEWTPLMLRPHDVNYKEFDEALTAESRQAIMGRIPLNFSGEECVEFLYLNGDNRGWTWGRNGMTNAAFVQRGAREYFRRFF